MIRRSAHHRGGLPDFILRRGLLLCCTSALLISCSDSETSAPTTETTEFEIKVENIGEAKRFPMSKAFSIPMGKDDPGPIGPGDSYEVKFKAPKGFHLSFATMLIQSNDWFYAPASKGIELYAADGTPKDGDITSELKLWDAGTEENQPAGEGNDQPSATGNGATSGAADSDPLVREITTFPVDLDKVLKVMLTAPTGTDATFTLKISNISSAGDLAVSAGTVDISLAPGVLVVHSATESPLFTAGVAAGSGGLEALAEAGNPADLAATLAAETGITPIFSPGVFAVHPGGNPLFTEGVVDSGLGLESLAEDGVPSDFATALVGELGKTITETITEAITSAFDIPVGDSEAGPLLPGKTYTFNIQAKPGDFFSLATMYVQSNDLFVAPSDSGISLFDADGKARSGDLTGELKLWDAGTEINEEPGFGPNQPLYQSTDDSGSDESSPLDLVDDAFTYPAIDSVLRLTVTKK